jgi:hypothetical protein
MPKLHFATDAFGRLLLSPAPGGFEDKMLQFDGAVIREIGDVDHDQVDVRFDAGAGSVVDFIGLLIRFNGDSENGDYMKLEIVDVDGVVYPAGTVLRDFGPKFYVFPGETMFINLPFLRMQFQTVFYLRFHYYRKTGYDPLKIPRYIANLVYLKYTG